DTLVGVATCREGDDVFLATRGGKCIRFRADQQTLRVFAGRDSPGVRGIRLLGEDRVISLATLAHVEASVEERAAYLKLAQARRRQGEEAEPPSDEAPAREIILSPERAAELERAEQFILTITDAGFGKRTSAYEYRVTGRGGQGITNIGFSPRTGRAVVASFVVQPGDHVMLVTDAGRLIRLPADQVRLTGRQALGVTMLRMEEGEHITSCFPVIESGEDPDG
ncbi:MAG: DNA gyrase subunit A, partial [Rhodovarius sp.]|nr:DNA gyrase subunit A [Rhodovarius sp.]